MTLIEALRAARDSGFDSAVWADDPRNVFPVALWADRNQSPLGGGYEDKAKEESEDNAWVLSGFTLSSPDWPYWLIVFPSRSVPRGLVDHARGLR